jgi:hypothetical protein
MRILLDTNVILNDFFHRNPDYGFQRISDPEQMKQVELYRQKVHESLLFLSLQKDVEIWSTTSVISRFGALLGDLLVPQDLVVAELQYILSNFNLAEVDKQELEDSLANMERSDQKMDFDDYLLKRISDKNEIDLIITSVPKSKSFFWPVLVFKPENIRELNFSAVS